MVLIIELALFPGIGFPVLFELLFHLISAERFNDFIQVIHFAIHINFSILVFVHVDLLDGAHFACDVLADHFWAFDLFANPVESVFNFLHLLYLDLALLALLVEKQTLAVVLFVETAECVEVEVRKTHFLLQLNIRLADQL
jgi:hypothetical protein